MSKEAFLKLLFQLLTLPYYRIFHFNTLLPICRIATCTSDPTQTRRLVRLLLLWRSRKLVELQYISIASAVVATIVTSSFSWTDVSSSFWLASALWYCSLLLSILGVLISSQQIAVLDILGLPHATGNIRKSEEQSARRNIRRFLPVMLSEIKRPSIELSFPSGEKVVGQWQPRWKMVFVWQCPVMFLSYAVVFYGFGLTIYVCSPLILGEWGPQANSAYVYLGVAFVSLLAFSFCAFWIYHYVDLESEDELEDMQSNVQEQGTQT